MSDKNSRLLAAMPAINKNAKRISNNAGGRFDWRDLVNHAILIYLESDADPDPIEGWITQVMRNQINSKYSQFRRQNDSEITCEIHEQEDYNELWEVAEIVADRLPELERKVIYLLSRGVTVTEISEASTIPKSTIYVVLNRAKKIIRSNID